MEWVEVLKHSPDGQMNFTIIARHSLHAEQTHKIYKKNRN
jgi:hypothetical protein